MTDIAGERRALAQQGLSIGTREGWKAAEDYTSERRVTMPALGFFLHISVTIDGGDLPADEAAAMRTIERIGVQRFGIGFPYNAASFDTGRLYEGQPLSRRGAHTVNDKGVEQYGAEGASLNYAYRALVLPQMEADDVTDVQIDSAARWAAAQIRAGYAVRGARWDLHNTVAWKACPGATASARLGELNRLTAHYEAVGLTQEDDMAFTQAALTMIVADAVKQAIDPKGPAFHNLVVAVRTALEQEVTQRGDLTRTALRELARMGADDAEANDTPTAPTS